MNRILRSVNGIEQRCSRGIGEERTKRNPGGANLFSIIVPCLNESENIRGLVETLYRQDFRPLEVIVVDDGSTDGTLTILDALKSELPGRGFNIVISVNDGPLHGPASARNIGIEQALGRYVLFTNADHVFLDSRLLTRLSEELESWPAVAFRTKIIADSWIELNYVLDRGDPPFSSDAKWSSLAVKRQILTGVRFDPEIGVGEDIAFVLKLKRNGMPEPKIVLDVTDFAHYPHSLAEYLTQRAWQGRTVWLSLRKKSGRSWLLLLFNIGLVCSPAGSLLAALVLSFVDLRFIAVGAIYLVAVGKEYLVSPSRGLSRLGYLLFRFSLGSFWFLVNAIIGLFQVQVLGQIRPQRGK